MKNYLMSLILSTITLLNVIFVIFTVFIERKKPVTAMTWILIFTFLPVVGFVLYLILGRNVHLNKKRLFKMKEEYDRVYDAALIEQKQMINSHAIDFNDSSMADYRDIIEMHLNNSRSIYTQDNDLTVFVSAADKYASLFRDIENAKRSIHLLYFIFNNDDIGNRLVELLTRKAGEGVEVRLLYDHVGSISTPFSMFKNLVRAGGQVYRFFPLRFGTYLRLNYRNHRKIVVIDGETGYVGGINIGDEYLGLHKHKTPWRDTHLRMTGTAVYFLQERFLMDWYYTSREEKISKGNVFESFFPVIASNGRAGVQIVSSGPDSSGEQIKRGYIKMINSAKEKIYIQSPYFIPDESFLEALQIAAMSGVDIRVMLPRIPDKVFVYRATTSYIKDLMNYGIKVYLYPGFLHAKMLTVDGKVTSIGTTNVDIRSFALDFEINAFIYDTAFSSQCEGIFEKDMKISMLVVKEQHDARKFGIKVQEGICRLFSPLL